MQPSNVNGLIWHIFAAISLVICADQAMAQRDLTDIPQPNPEAELAAMRVDAAAAVNLYAADPDIRKPIQMNFDSQGGLWIASSEIYPQILPGEKADDKIIVLRDTDGDGVAETRTVFARGLLIPTGVIPDGPHAAYVAESTRLLYLQDTDGDGQADTRRVVLSGFGTEDTHHLVHTLRWGPDGCLYFNQSIYIHSHIDTPYGTRHLDGGGIWRYRPSSGRLEVVCKGFVNPWGHVFDSLGESFVTDGAYFEGINYVFPDAVFVTSPGATRWLKGLNPGSPKHCGLEILSGTHIPPQWQGDFVTNDFRSHRVCRFTVKPNGSGYLSRQQPEIITTEHVAFRPIDARMGPDGALYVADWYNPIIQHGEVDFRDDRRDRKHGRIWRVSFPERPLDRWPDFSEQSEDQLLALLEDPALAVRQFARQQLWQRAKKDPDGILNGIGRWRDSGDVAARSLEVAWMYEVVGRVAIDQAESALRTTQRAGSDSQRTLMRSLWRNRIHLPPDSPAYNKLLELITSRVDDEDPRVRLEAVLCNGQLRGVGAVDRVARAASMPIDGDLDFAIWQALRNLSSQDAESILDKIQWSGRHDQLAFAVAAIGNSESAETAVKLIEQGSAEPESLTLLVQAVAASADASQLGRVLKSLLTDSSQDSVAEELAPLLERTARDGTVPSGAGDALLAVASTAEAMLANAQWAGALADAAATWKAAPLEKVLTEVLPRTDGELQEKVIAALGSLESESAKRLVDALAKDDDSSIRLAATRAIALSRPRSAIDATVGLLQEDATRQAASELVVGMLRRQDLPPILAAAIEQRGLQADHARSLLSHVRSGGGSPVLETAIRKAGKLDDAAWKLTPELSRRVLSLANRDGSPSRGEAVYRRASLQCINCHAIGTAGGLVGPNLISVGGSSQPDYILESLIDPSAKLKEGYTTVTVLTIDSEVINGIVIGNTEDAIRLRLADGKEQEIAIEDIEQQRPGRSLMPEGALDALTEQELVDLVAFLSALGRSPEFTVSTEPLVRSFQTLNYTDEANRRLNRTSTDTAASDDPAMTWRALTAKVDGTLPVEQLDRFQQHRETPPTSFVKFAIELPGPGAAGIELPSEGIEAWVDGKPMPVWNLKSAPLSKGPHSVVIAIDRTKVTKPLAVRLVGDAIEPSE